MKEKSLFDELAADHCLINWDFYTSKFDDVIKPGSFQFSLDHPRYGL